MTDCPLALTATGIGQIAGLGPDAIAQVSDLRIGLLILPVLVQSSKRTTDSTPATYAGTPVRKGPTMASHDHFARFNRPVEERTSERLSTTGGART